MSTFPTLPAMLPGPIRKGTRTYHLTKLQTARQYIKAVEAYLDSIEALVGKLSTKLDKATTLLTPS